MATATSDALAISTLEDLPLRSLIPHPDNPRSVLDVDEDFVASCARGIEEPLLVTPTGAGDGTHWIVAGHRRHEGARRAGLATVPCIVRTYSEAGALEAMLVENGHREDLKPLDEARALQKLVKGHKQKQVDVARHIGRSQAHISKRLALLKLPDDVQAKIGTGKLSVGAGVELAKLAGHPERLAVAVKMGGNDPAWIVERELADIERQHRRDAKRDELEEQRVAVIDFPARGRFETTEEKPLAGQASHHGNAIWAVQIDAEAHASEPCHAATVDDNAEVVWICTDPKRHVAPVDDRQDDDTGAQRSALVAPPPARDLEAEERERTRAVLGEVAKVRRDAMRRLLADKLAVGDVLAHLIDMLFAEQAILGLEVDDEVAALLDIELPEETYRYEPEYLEPFRTYASTSDAHRARLALAIAFAVGDPGAGMMNRWGSDAEVTGHFAYLEAHGYVPADIERERLAIVADEPVPVGPPLGAVEEVSAEAVCSVCGADLGEGSYNDHCAEHLTDEERVEVGA